MLNQHIATLRRHLPSVADVVVGQLLAQILMAGAGFLLVRGLSKQDYAAFSVFSAIVAMMTLLADSGLAAGINSRGGGFVQDKPRLAALWGTARKLLRSMWIPGGVLMGGVGWWLLARLQCPPGLVLTLVATAFIGMVFSTEGHLNTAVHNLLGRRRLVQWSLIAAQGSRLLIVLTCWLMSCLNLLVAVASAIVAGLVSLRVTRKPLAGEVAAPFDLADKSHLLTCTRRTMPNAVFVCVQGQLATLILGAFGQVDSVADLGALSRIAVLFAVLGAPIHYLAAPIFARAADHRQLTKVLVITLLAYLTIGSIILAAVYIWPQPFLWILGPGYSGLARELTWVVFVQLLGMIESIVWAVAISRAWLSGAWIMIPGALVSQVLILYWVNPATIFGALALTAIQSVAKTFVALCLVVLGLRHLKAAAL